MQTIKTNHVIQPDSLIVKNFTTVEYRARKENKLKKGNK